MRATGQVDKYLALMLKGEQFGIPVLRIKEIIEYREMTPVPMLPDCIPGAISLRGHGVPVVDLACRLGKGRTSAGSRTCVVIVEMIGVRGTGFDVGLLADAVTEVLDIAGSDIEPAPSFDGTLDTDFLAGLARVGEGRFIILLDVDRILSLTNPVALDAPHEPTEVAA